MGSNLSGMLVVSVDADKSEGKVKKSNFIEYDLSGNGYYR